MIDQYKCNINKLIIELSTYSSLDFEELKFIISNMVQLGINNINLDLKNTIDYNYLINIVDFISSECNTYDIGITSECIGIQPYLKRLKNSGLRDIVICIDSLKQYKYKNIHCGANINDIIKIIDTCINLNLNTTLKCMVVNGFNNDEINDYISMTKSLPINICLSEIIPKNNKLEEFNKSYINIESILDANPNLSKLDNRKTYKLLNSVGTICVESHNDSKNCINCNEIIITDNGLLKTCVHKNSAFDIKTYMYKPLIFKETIKEIIYLKEKLIYK